MILHFKQCVKTKSSFINSNFHFFLFSFYPPSLLLLSLFSSPPIPLPFSSYPPSLLLSPFSSPYPPGLPLALCAVQETSILVKLYIYTCSKN